MAVGSAKLPHKEVAGGGLRLGWISGLRSLAVLFIFARLVGEHDPLPLDQGQGLPEMLGGVLPVNLDQPALGFILGPEETLAAPAVDLGRGTPPEGSRD